MIGAFLSGGIYTCHLSFLVTLEIQMWFNTEVFTDKGTEKIAIHHDT